jgi:hypothetical protein
MAVKWNPDTITILKKYGDSNDLARAAKFFKCTMNAVRIKYNKVKNDPTGKPLFKALTVQKPGEKNPFEITQEEFTGGNTTHEIMLLLVKQMLNIKPNKTDCIRIPLTVADSKRVAANIFQQAKNYLAKTNKADMVFTIKSTFSGDKNKSYLGGRIWRLK